MSDATLQYYLIALGSNRRHRDYGNPRNVIALAVQTLRSHDLRVIRQSKTITTNPIGPSIRNYANGAVLISTALDPTSLLLLLKKIERQHGTRRGQRWSARVLDLDIIWWSEGIWTSTNPPLSVPHLAFRERDFVLRPCAEIAPSIVDPISGLTMAQLFHRQNRRKPLDL